MIPGMKYSRDFLRLSLTHTRRSLGRFATLMMPAYELDPCHQLMIDRDEDLLRRCAVQNSKCRCWCRSRGSAPFISPLNWTEAGLEPMG